MTTPDPAEELAAIVHAITCTRCRQGWTCGGVSDEDVERAANPLVADALAAHDAQVRAEHGERIAQALREMASVEFDANGPRDIRGAAIWDCAAYVTEGRTDD